MPKHRLLALSVAVSLFTFGADKKAPKQKTVKVQKSFISMAQEIQLGKEAALAVGRQMEVVDNPEIEAWLNRIGAQLAKTPQANAYPYYLRLVNEDSINAFALPGGPMFVHTGLIKAVDNEGQLAGVLAHAMSHVALRHGVSQIGRSQTEQTVLSLAGAAAGMAGDRASSLGVGALLSKYSRDAESDADLNGARMLAAAGYDPLEMVHFFEKLEKEMDSKSRPMGLDTWFASHPASDRRVEAVSADIQFYAVKHYGPGTGQFSTIQQRVAAISPPKMKPAVALQPIQTQPREGLPKGFADLRTKDFAVACPEGWQPVHAPAGGSFFVVPQGGAIQSQKGGIELIAGAVFDYFTPPPGSEELGAATKALLASLQRGDPNMKIANTEPVNVGGKAGILTHLTTRTSYRKDAEQVVHLYSVVRPAGLWTLALAFPKSMSAEGEPIFRQVVQTVAFAE